MKAPQQPDIVWTHLKIIQELGPIWLTEVGYTTSRVKWVNCLKALKMIVRHLEVNRVSSQSGNVNYSLAIVQEVLQCRSILEKWEIIAGCVPLKYEQYMAVSSCLVPSRNYGLQYVGTHSHVKKYSKGIRKTLSDLHM